MKRIIAGILALALMLCATALGEAFDATTVTVDTPVVSDLDGDGTNEEWVWTVVEDEFEHHLRLTVTADAGQGDSATYDVWTIDSERLLAADLDGDGRTELLASGDVMSDDYYTWCLYYKDGAIYDIVFADAERGENTMGYFTEGYGLIVGLKDGVLTLSGSQDVLGTWFGTRGFRLMPNGRFEFADDGRWIRQIDLSDKEVWDYAALTVKAPVPCEIGGAATTLNPGERCMITGSDKVTEATFVTEDGREGVFHIEPNWQAGWGMMVDGVPEDELFEYLPYAD